MTITASSLGDNTIKISLDGIHNTLDNLKTAFKNAVTGVDPVKSTGWTVHDEFTTGTFYTLVIKALNADGSTYKNAIIRFDTLEQEINVSTCESWDAVTHVATNEAYTYNNCAPIQYALNSCDIIIQIHPRWFNLMAYVTGEPSNWSGVFEMVRSNLKDATDKTLPCWGWTSSVLPMIGAATFNVTPVALGQQPLICMPRTPDNSTSVNAARYYACNMGVNTYPSKDYNAGPGLMYQLGSSTTLYRKDGFDTTKKPILPIRPVYRYNEASVFNYGQVYGLHLITNTYKTNELNKVSATLDSNGLFSTSGTKKDMFVLNTHWKSTTAISTSSVTNPTTETLIVKTPENTSAYDIVSVGKFIYFINAARGIVYRYDYFTKIVSIVLTGNNGTLNSLKYDGDQYLYISTAAGVTRLTIANNAMTTASVGGTEFIAITSTNIYAFPLAGQTATTGSIWKITKSTFVATTAVSVTGMITVGTGQTGKWVNAIVDENDNCQAAISYSGTGQASTAAAGAGFLYLISFANTATSAGINSIASGSAMGTGYYYAVGLKYIGNKLLVVGSYYNTYPTPGQYGSAWIINKASSTIASTITGASSNNTWGISYGRAIKMYYFDGLLTFNTMSSGNYVISLGFTPLASSVTDPTVTGRGNFSIGNSSGVSGIFGNKLIGPHTNGIQIYTKFRNISANNGATLGQFVLPA